MARVSGQAQRKNVSATIKQSERYSVGFGSDDGFSFAGGPWGSTRYPFVLVANGRSYLKQIETESGVWFRDTRRPVTGEVATPVLPDELHFDVERFTGHTSLREVQRYTKGADQKEAPPWPRSKTERPLANRTHC